MIKRAWWLAAVAMVATAGSVQAYTPVTDARLANPEPHNWLMTRGTYKGWSYSPLDQINTRNVKNLVPVWTFATGRRSGHQSPPIVNDGYMFITQPDNQVIALDARTGEEIWRFQGEGPEEFSALHNTNRGVSLYDDKVYVAMLYGDLVALEAKTGKVAWTTRVANWKVGEYMTMAPLTVKGKIVVGISGGEFGIRGFIAAYDAKTGKEAWKTYTIPAPGEPGSETWRGDDWKRGGASAWMTGNYDPGTNTIYWGVGNASPWFGDQRPGDNLYTASTMALDGDTGKIKGHFQYHWNDSWDWDEMNAPMIVDYTWKGRTVNGLFKVSRNGYLYWLERLQNGAIGFVDAKPYVYQDVFASIDPKTGRPTYHPDKIPGTGKKASFCPSLWGGKDWPFEAFNPQTRMVYIPANDNHCGFLEGKVQEYVAGKWWTGVDIPDIGFTVKKDAKSFGEIQAWKIDTGEKAWTVLYPKSMNWGSILTTAGGLVFNGGTQDRMFRAYDAVTGEQLWQIKTSSGIIAPPSSYMIDGVQYVAVQAGWGVDPQFQQGLLSNLIPGWPKATTEGGVLWVFALQQ